MKILIVGSIKAVFIKHFLESFPSGYELDVYDYDDSITEYPGHNVIKPTKWVKLWKKLHARPLQYLALKNQFKKLYKEYDIVNLHYVTPWFTRVMGSTKDKLSNVVFSYWGSDLFRNDKKKLLKFSPIIGNIGYVTFSSNDLYNYHVQLYGENSCKRKVSMFPITLIELMDECDKKYNKDKAEFEYNIAGVDIPSDKTIVAIGYNGREAQQHIKVLNAMSSIDSKYRDKIAILLQMTSGGSREYRESVVATAREMGFEVIHFDKYLDDEDVAKIRMITDVYINAQTTDAFSASVCENLYMGTSLINASWLKYAELKMSPFSYLEFNNFDDITGLLVRVMDGEFVPDKETNRRLVKEYKSRENCRENWMNIYNEVAEKG